MPVTTLERGKRLYEALIYASDPGASCEWVHISTVANGLGDAFHLTITANGRTLPLPPISFTDLEKLATEGNPKLEQEVRQIMAAFG